MTFSPEQKQTIQKGEAVAVTLDGVECMVLRRDVYDRMKKIAEYDDQEVSPREFYPLVDRIMAEDDANDPGLESYQHYERNT